MKAILLQNGWSCDTTRRKDHGKVCQQDDSICHQVTWYCVTLTTPPASLQLVVCSCFWTLTLRRRQGCSESVNKGHEKHLVFLSWREIQVKRMILHYFVRNFILYTIDSDNIGSAGVSPEMNQECSDYITHSGIICRMVEWSFPPPISLLPKNSFAQQ